MAFPQPGFQNPSTKSEKKLEKGSLTPEENLKLVQKYLTPEGKGNELFAEYCRDFFLRKGVIGGIIGHEYPNNVEDVMQEAILNAVLNLRQFDGRALLETWLYKIAVHEAFDFLRKAKVRKDVSRKVSLDDLLLTGEDIADPSIDIDRALENTDLLEHMLKNLTEHQRNIMILHYVEGYSPQEIADKLGMNYNTIKVQLMRTKQAIIKYITRKRLKK